MEQSMEFDTGAVYVLILLSDRWPVELQWGMAWIIHWLLNNELQLRTDKERARCTFINNSKMERPYTALSELCMQ